MNGCASNIPFLLLNLLCIHYYVILENYSNYTIYYSFIQPSQVLVEKTSLTKRHSSNQKLLKGFKSHNRSGFKLHMPISLSFSIHINHIMQRFCFALLLFKFPSSLRSNSWITQPRYLRYCTGKPWSTNTTSNV